MTVDGFEWHGSAQTGRTRTVVFPWRVGNLVTLGPDGFEVTGGNVVHGEALDVERGTVVQVTVSAQAGDRRTLLVRRDETA